MAKGDQGDLTVLRMPEVGKRTGLSRSTIYLFIEQGTFPKPIKLGKRCSGWLAGEIDQWIKKRVEQRDSGVAA